MTGAGSTTPTIRDGTRVAAGRVRARVHGQDRDAASIMTGERIADLIISGKYREET